MLCSTGGSHWTSEHKLHNNTHKQGLEILISDISMEMECKINLQSMLTLLLPPFLKQTIENVKYISLSN